MIRIRFVALLVVSLLLGAVAVPVAASAQGNSDAADQCKKGGYVNYTDAEGNEFENTGQCVKYAAQGNELVPVDNEDTPTGCENEAWRALAPAEDPTTAFDSEEDCADYVSDVGDPVAYVPPVDESKLTGCEDGAWARLAPADDEHTAFANKDECDAYVWNVGQPVTFVPQEEEPVLTGCEDGAWSGLARADDEHTAFTNKDECDAYVWEGGTPVTFVPINDESILVERCIQEAVAAGYNVRNANVIVGTEGDDLFTHEILTDGVELICGFGGDDHIDTFGVDAFMGGDGSDSVSRMTDGIFNGGHGSDYVNYMVGYSDFEGVFDGGPDADRVSQMTGGMFFGGPGEDYVGTLTITGQEYGFFGGSGVDEVEYPIQGSFVQDGYESLMEFLAEYP